MFHVCFNFWCWDWTQASVCKARALPLSYISSFVFVEFIVHSQNVMFSIPCKSVFSILFVCCIFISRCFEFIPDTDCLSCTREISSPITCFPNWFIKCFSLMESHLSTVFLLIVLTDLLKEFLSYPNSLLCTFSQHAFPSCFRVSLLHFCLKFVCIWYELVSNLHLFFLQEVICPYTMCFIPYFLPLILMWL